MRNGDVYRIQRMVEVEGASEKEVLERFKHDYPKDEILKFIPGGKQPSVGLEEARTVAELTTALKEVGVDIPEGSKKADLEALRESALQPPVDPSPVVAPDPLS